MATGDNKRCQWREHRIGFSSMKKIDGDCLETVQDRHRHIEILVYKLRSQ